MKIIKAIHFNYVRLRPVVKAVRDRSTGVDTIIITYIVLAVFGLIGSVIAVDKMKAAQND